jgi:maleate isomerase
MSANVAALRQMRAHRIVVATAYLERINRSLQRYFEDAGFEVLGMKGLEVSKPVDQAKLSEDASYRVARALFQEHPNVDGVLIHGRWSSLGYVEKLEQEIGCPVVSSVAASLWRVIKTLRIDLKVEGYGRILVDG